MSKNLRYALLSVFDKTGIVEFARTLKKLNYSIISTNGTTKVLTDHGITVIPVGHITGNPESFDRRVKTISFAIESGILFDRSNPKHVQEAKRLNVPQIDIVVCNLYPFEQKQTIETIDIGGPTMIRAAAKNYEHVLVAVDPKDYNDITSILPSIRILSRKRKELAAKAFAYLSLYDSLVAKYLEPKLFPNLVTIPGKKFMDLRYGENPHQQAAFYRYPNTNSPLTRLKKLWGRDLSLTNLSDINAGIESVRFFEEPTAALIKHNSPCGIALGRSTAQALKRSIEADPESAFGGAAVLNTSVDRKTAAVIAQFKNKTKANIDIVAAPSVERSALNLLRETRKSMGVYTFGKLKVKSQKSKVMALKWVDGGFVLQTPDALSFANWEVVTKKKPTKKQLQQMQIAWKFITRIRSNAVIVVDKDFPMTRGIGSGQTSRVRSTKIALEQAGKHASGAILASDSFFPFDDSVKFAAKHGISAIVQQGGSVNDQASIDAANKAGIVMVFTHRRAFWH